MIKKKLIRDITRRGYTRPEIEAVEPLKFVDGVLSIDQASLDIKNYDEQINNLIARTNENNNSIQGVISAIEDKASKKELNEVIEVKQDKIVNSADISYVSKSKNLVINTELKTKWSGKQDRLNVGLGLNLENNTLTLTSQFATLEEVKQEIAKAELDDITLNDVQTNLIAPLNAKILELESKDIQLQQAKQDKLSQEQLTSISKVEGLEQELQAKQDKLTQEQLANIDKIKSMEWKEANITFESNESGYVDVNISLPTPPIFNELSLVGRFFQNANGSGNNYIAMNGIFQLVNQNLFIPCFLNNTGLVVAQIQGGKLAEKRIRIFTAQGHPLTGGTRQDNFKVFYR